MKMEVKLSNNNKVEVDDEHSNEPVYSHLPAGRYEFKDNGIYIGEWLNEKAVGIGLLTKDKSQGEYTGLWNNGSEKCGVFLWPTAPGAMYEGDWSCSKRNGYGIFVKEDWVIKGRFEDGFLTLGVRFNERKTGKFEGVFVDGCAVFGMETYVDGGTYSGDYKTGLRQGYGVRSTAPYGEIYTCLPEERLPSAAMAAAAMAAASNGGSSTGGSLPNKFRGGFNLSGRRSDLLMKKLQHISQCKKHKRLWAAGEGGKKPKRSRSLTSVFSAVKKKDLFDADMCSVYLQNSSSHYGGHGGEGVGGSMRSMPASFTFQTVASITARAEETNALGGDTIGPDVVEVFSGDWVQDRRHGHGVCVRSDGVVYHGAWSHNQRHGYGVTLYADGSIEEGRYQNNKLVALWTRRNLLFVFPNLQMSLKIHKAVNLAKKSATIAREKARECERKLMEIREAAKRSDESAALAREYSLETRMLVKVMYPLFDQPGIKCLKDIVRNMRVTKRGQEAFESMLRAALDVVEGRGIPEMLVDKDTTAATDDRNQDSSLLLTDDQGKQMQSRHGSFRRSKKKSAVNGASSDDSGTGKGDQTGSNAGVNKTLGTNAGTAAGRQDKNIEPLVSPRRTAALSRAAPTASGASPRTSANQQSSIAAKTAISEDGTRKRPGQRSQTLSSSSSKRVIPIISTTGPRDSLNVTESSNPGEPASPEEDEAEFISASNIVATSSIPREALGDILTSESMRDHFQHYRRPDNPPLPSPPQEPHRNSQSSSSSPRRFTVPDIMTQPPVAPHPVGPVAFCRVQEEDEGSDDDGKGTNKSGVMYMRDNGVCKRVCSQLVSIDKQANNSSDENISGSRVTLSAPQDSLSPLPLQFMFQNESSRRQDSQEGSLPNVSGAFRRHPGLSREEVDRLGQLQRMREEEDSEKRRHGVLIIQLQRIKDWLVNHFIVIFVVLINVLFLYAIFDISKDFKIS